MNVQLLAAKVVQTLRQDGLRAALRKSYAYLRGGPARDDFDVKHGTATGGIEGLWKFEISSPNRRFGVRYSATEGQELVDAVNSLHENLGTFSFVDLGCGKGRPLVVAANMGFGRIIGVEFARELVEIARENLASRAIANGVVEHTDAADYSYPT